MLFGRWIWKCVYRFRPGLQPVHTQCVKLAYTHLEMDWTYWRRLLHIIIIYFFLSSSLGRITNTKTKIFGTSTTVHCIHGTPDKAGFHILGASTKSKQAHFKNDCCLNIEHVSLNFEDKKTQKRRRKTNHQQSTIQLLNPFRLEIETEFFKIYIL